MDENQLSQILSRIDKLEVGAQAKFGKMNSHQMVCHVSDQIRVALGIKTDVVSGGMEPKEVIEKSLAGEFVPTPKGLGQVEGDGTKPLDFEEDKSVLKDLLSDIFNRKESFPFSPHPYLGPLPKFKWLRVTSFHCDHHLKQFGV